jgi:hypothetical protein
MELITINPQQVACELAHARTFDEFRDELEDDECNMYTTDDLGITESYKDYIQERFNTWYGWYEDHLNSFKQ